MGSSTRGWSATVPPRFSSRSRSSIKKAHELLGEHWGSPPLRLSNAACRLTGRDAAPRRARTSCPVSPPESGPSATCSAAETNAAPGPTTRAPPGDRCRGAGGVHCQVLREVVEEAEHGSVGPVQVLDDEHGGPWAAWVSRKARQAAKFSSREASAASRPRRGRRRARIRSRWDPPGGPARYGLPCGPRRRSRGCRRTSGRSPRAPRR